MIQERRKSKEVELEVIRNLYVRGFVEAKVRWFGHEEAWWGWSCQAGNHRGKKRS